MLRPPNSARRRSTPTAGIAGDLSRMRARADAWRTLEADPDLMAAKLIADAWCAAFVQPKAKSNGPTPDSSGQGITHSTLRNLSRTRDQCRTPYSRRSTNWRANTVSSIGIWNSPASSPSLTTQRRTPTPDGTVDSPASSENPPWERLKIQDKEFFGNLGRTDIETAANAAIRKKMIETPGRHRPRPLPGIPRRAAPIRRHRAPASQERTLPPHRTGRRQHLQRLRRNHAHHHRTDRRRRNHHPHRTGDRQNHRPISSPTASATTASEPSTTSTTRPRSSQACITPSDSR